MGQVILSKTAQPRSKDFLEADQGVSELVLVT
jgi:hypothetical protein